MDGSLNILWGRGEGSSPGIARKSTLLWWMRVDRGPFLSDQVKIVILRGCKWTGEIIDIFLRPFGGSFVGEAICIGGSIYWDFQTSTWERRISRLLWLDLTGMWI